MVPLPLASMYGATSLARENAPNDPILHAISKMLHASCGVHVWRAACGVRRNGHRQDCTHAATRNGVGGKQLFCKMGWEVQRNAPVRSGVQRPRPHLGPNVVHCDVDWADVTFDRCDGLGDRLWVRAIEVKRGCASAVSLDTVAEMLKQVLGWIALFASSHQPVWS